MTAHISGQQKAPVTHKSSSASSNVRVVSRVRPLARYELEKGCQPVVTKVPHLSNEGPEVLQIKGPEQRWFELDAVMTESCTQQEVYEKSGAYTAISDDLFSGFNCTILAYGQTGAGKVRLYHSVLDFGSSQSSRLTLRSCHLHSRHLPWALLPKMWPK